MKKYILIYTFLFLSIAAIAQTEGISYQAVILDNNALELPGQDLADNYLANGEVSLRFTIYDHYGSIIYQEIQMTTTDIYGHINLVIGQGERTGGIFGFQEIDWDGNPKDLQVELSYLADEFQELSRQALLYLPYAYHRNIVASGTLNVIGATHLHDDLTVEGTAQFNGNTIFNTITVMNESDLQGDVTVGGTTVLLSDLNVQNESNTSLSGGLQVSGFAEFEQNVNVAGNAIIQGNGNIEGDGTVDYNMTVGGTSYLNGQVRINANLPDGVQNNSNDYPLRVAGGAHGIAIQVNDDNPNRNTNFITFFNSSGIAEGRIEGFNGLQGIAESIIESIITDAEDDAGDIDTDDEDSDVPPSEVPPSALQYLNNNYTMGALDHALDVANGYVTFYINLSAALGLCLSGDCDDPIWAAVDVVVQILQYELYVIANEINIGVAFESGGADYAEWLQKANPNENLVFGDVVGVKAGIISKEFKDANQFMVVSKNPTVIGAMPNEGQESDFEKIAFMGQVPVKTSGKVNLGDYILPSGNGDGMAIAVSPSSMKARDYSRIIGVAWEESNGEALFTFINTAVGLNTNDMALMVENMQVIMNNMQEAIAEVNPNYSPNLFDVENRVISNANDVSTAPSLTQQLASQLELSKNMNKEIAMKRIKEYVAKQNVDLSKYPYAQEVLNDPENEELIDEAIAHYTRVSERLTNLVYEIKRYNIENGK